MIDISMTTERLAELKDLLEEMLDFLDDYVDADHNGNDYVPNEAMRLSMNIEDFLNDNGL